MARASASDAGAGEAVEPRIATIERVPAHLRRNPIIPDTTSARHRCYRLPPLRVIPVTFDQSVTWRASYRYTNSHMLFRFAFLGTMAAAIVWGGDWNPRLAAQYLDSRQEKWFSWPTATASGTPCVSCHTGATYLLVRPALRRALNESQPTRYEAGLLSALRGRVPQKTAKELFPKNNDSFAAQGTGVESIFAALFLATENPQSTTLPAEAEQ